MSKHTLGPWCGKAQGGPHKQGLVISETTGENIAVVYDVRNLAPITATLDLLAAAVCALADLQGIMPGHEPGGERTHPAWRTIDELRAAIEKAGQA